MAGQKEPVSRNCGLMSGNRMKQLSRNLICSGIFAVKTQILICYFVAGLKKRDRSCLFNSCGFDQTLKRKPDMRKQAPGLRRTHIYTQVKHLFSFIIVSSAFGRDPDEEIFTGCCSRWISSSLLLLPGTYSSQKVLPPSFSFILCILLLSF